MRGLLATTDDAWRIKAATALLNNNVDVHTTRTASDCIDLLRKHPYQIVVIDDSLHDLNALEFSLTVREFCGDTPQILIAAPELEEKIQRFKRLAKVQFIGTKKATTAHIKKTAADLANDAS